MGTFPFDKRYPITSDYKGHLSRGSKTPGIDFATPMISPIVAPFDGWMQQETSGFAGAIALSVTSKDKTVKYFIAHLSSVVGSHREVKEGDLIGYTGNSGNVLVYRNGEWVTPTTQERANGAGAHSHICGKRPWNGKWYDVLPELNSMPVKTNVIPQIPSIDLAAYQKQIDDLKKELDETIASNKADITKLEVEVISRQSEIESLIRKNSELQVYANQYNLQLDNIVDITSNIVQESIDLNGLLDKWGIFVDKHFKSQTLQSLLKYDLITGLLISISTVLAVGVAPYLRQLGIEINDTLAFGIGTGLGVLFKVLKVRYDRNGDGKITNEDYTVLS